MHTHLKEMGLAMKIIEEELSSAQALINNMVTKIPKDHVATMAIQVIE